MQQYIAQSGDVVRLKNSSIRKSSLRFEITRANPAVANQGIDLSKVNITIEVMQKGIKRTTTFPALNAYNFSFLDKFDSKVINLAPITALGLNTTGGEIFTNGADRTQMFEIPVTKFPFLLQGDDYMNVTVQILSGAYGSANVNSVCYFVTKDGTDLVQEAIILPKYLPVTDNRSDLKEDLGTICSLALFNSNNLTADQGDCVYNSVDIKSAYYNDNITSTELLEKSADYSGRMNFFNLFQSSNKFLKNASIYANVQVASVTVGIDYVYYEEVVPSASLFQAQQKRNQRIAFSKLNTLRN